jgi:membrane protein
MTAKSGATEGRSATTPSEFGRAAWVAVLWRVWGRVTSDHLSIVSAGVAFFGALALFPAIASLVGLYGFVANPADIARNLEAVRPVLPRDAYALVETQVASLTGARSELGFASLVALAIALWSARLGVTGLIEGLNIAYRETENRSLVRQYLLSLVLTLLLLTIGIVAILAVVAFPALLRIFGIAGAPGAWVAGAAPVVILGCAIVFVIGALYRYAPDRRQARKRWISSGAVLATALWVLASLLLSFYISRFADFSKTYGSLGAFVGLLFWLYLSAFVVLLGAALNAEMELQTEEDTTVGRPKPMGARGAFVADNVAPLTEETDRA